MNRKTKCIFHNYTFDIDAANISIRTYVITAPRIIRPGMIYRISVAVLPNAPDLMVVAFITKGKNKQQIASAQEMIDSGSSHHLLMKVFIYLFSF